MARPGSTSRRSMHVGRYLGALLALLVAMYAVVAFAGPGSRWLRPTLGLDLQGGASVILEARPEAGRQATQGQLDTAVDIIRQRVNGAGVSEAEVVVQGTNIVVSVPGGNRSSIKNVTQTAQLRFREVLDVAAGTPTAAQPDPSTELLPDPAATPAPAATPSAPAVDPSAAVVDPAATPSPAGRVLPPAALEQATPEPSAPVTPAPAAAPAPEATPTPAPAATPGQPVVERLPGEVLTGDPATDENFAALDCTLDEEPRRRAATTTTRTHRSWPATRTARRSTASTSPRSSAPT